MNNNLRQVIEELLRNSCKGLKIHTASYNDAINFRWQIKNELRKLHKSHEYGCIYFMMKKNEHTRIFY